MKITEKQLRQLVREALRRIDEGSFNEYRSEWELIMDIMRESELSYDGFEDIGMKEIDGETVHEFAINNVVFQISKL